MNLVTVSGFELKICDSGNMIHFSIFTIQIFPPSQRITIPKYNTVSYSETEKQNFLSAPFKNNFKQFQYVCIMFSENSSNTAAYMLKLQVINPSYLKKLSEW